MQNQDFKAFFSFFGGRVQKVQSYLQIELVVVNFLNLNTIITARNGFIN